GFSSPLFAQSSSSFLSPLSPLSVGEALPGVPSVFSSPRPSPGVPPYAKSLSLAGPRFGLTMLSDDTIQKLHEHDIDVRSTISQFGWQFEHEFYSKQDGPTVLN